MRRALDSGAYPALARLRDDGSHQAISSVFPSVTGPAYAPFLLGRFPGPIGLPGLRWFDRARDACSGPDYCRSYIGIEIRHIDRDIDPDAPTMFELARTKLGAMNMINRGLRRSDMIGRSLAAGLRTASVHFRGDVRGWLAIDRDVGHAVARHVRTRRPQFTFAALPGIDKTSHKAGHDAPVVAEAVRVVDETVAEIRHDAERAGAWEHTHLWVVSDHGHSRVLDHDELVDVVRALGHRVVAHPWVYRRRGEVAVMVSGNAMAMLYLELAHPDRPFWPALAARWGALADALLERPSVDLMILPHSPDAAEVRSRDRGAALIERTGQPGAFRYTYRPLTGDPLAIGAHERLTADESHELTMASDYPDGLVQLAHLAGAARAGEIILSASRDWDFRARYEPIPHASTHGALHREHMLVPLLTNHPLRGTARRTVDVMPAALEALGLPVPTGLDGRSFL